MLLGGDTGSYPNICFLKYLRIKRHFPHYVLSDHTSFRWAKEGSGEEDGARHRCPLWGRGCALQASVCREDMRWRHSVGLEEELQDAHHIRDRNGYCSATCPQVRDADTETQKEEVLISPLGPQIRTKWRRKWQPTPVLLPGKSHRWRSLVGSSS